MYQIAVPARRVGNAAAEAAMPAVVLAHLLDGISWYRDEHPSTVNLIFQPGVLTGPGERAAFCQELADDLSTAFCEAFVVTTAMEDPGQLDPDPGEAFGPILPPAVPPASGAALLAGAAAGLQGDATAAALVERITDSRSAYLTASRDIDAILNELDDLTAKLRKNLLQMRGRV